MNEEAAAAGLAALPGMGPAALCRLLDVGEPTAAWSAIVEGPSAVRRILGLDRPSPDRAPLELPWAVSSDAGDPGSAAGPSESGAGRSLARRLERWTTAARRADLDTRWRRWGSQGIRVTWRGAWDYPASLVDDPQPPGVLFWRGRLDGLAGSCVALIGTRRCSPDGRACAFELGRDLVAAGVGVVSGLALGIDGAAHLGALQGGERREATGGDQAGAPMPRRPGGGSGLAVAVVASGVDVPYPRRHADLWEEVAAAGAVVSEAPPGSAAQAWRFPSRNRIIAGLADLVVVVESHARGGSMITVEAALARGRDVRAVPGPVHSPASAGTNQLLYDGAGPVRGAQDVLDALGLLERSRPGTGHHARRHSRAQSLPPRPPAAGGHQGGRPRRSGGPGWPPGQTHALADRAVPPGARELGPLDPASGGALDGGVLEAVGWRPVTLSAVVARTGFTVAAVSAALAALEDAGLVRCDVGWWCRRSG